MLDMANFGLQRQRRVRGDALESKDWLLMRCGGRPMIQVPTYLLVRAFHGVEVCVYVAWITTVHFSRASLFWWVASRCKWTVRVSRLALKVFPLQHCIEWKKRITHLRMAVFLCKYFILV